MTVKQRAAEVASRLRELYPEAECSLGYQKDYELLFSARLSAQCTDARVNEIAPLLFKRYPSLEALAGAELADIEDIVRPCGYYKAKAGNIKEASRLLMERHGGRVPDSMDDLLALPGVGRKTANLMIGDLFGRPAVVADTHCIRLSNRIGLCRSKNPVKVEARLRAVVAPDEQNMLCHRFVYHGRAVCRARKPDCGACVLAGLCAAALI